MMVCRGELLAPMRTALAAGDVAAAADALTAVSAPQAVFRVSHPFGELAGPQAFSRSVLATLHRAWPDLERRDWLVMEGRDDSTGAWWIGCGAHYVGTFVAPLLDIPPTGQLTHLRCHEYYRISDGRVVEYQGIFDLVEVMMQASAWPMAPSLGREMYVPGPATADGLQRPVRDPEESADSLARVSDMLAHLGRHPSAGGPEVMEMPRFWSERMNWYGPAGIGSARGYAGFRHWHQIPFLRGMPDRGLAGDGTAAVYFADNAYVGLTGWPNMTLTLTGDGWLGIVPTNRRLFLRSLDFWRLAAGRIRENWVLVDLLDMWRQLGVDVFARLREFNKSRVCGSVSALTPGVVP